MRALPPLTLLGLILIGSGLVACDAAPGETDRAFSSSGKITAMSGGAGGAANACFTCHGLDGGGDGVAAPRLAGLDAGYLQKQLEDYASGLRPDDAMTRIAKALDQQGRREVAAYYAALPAPPVPTPVRLVRSVETVAYTPLSVSPPPPARAPPRPPSTAPPHA